MVDHRRDRVIEVRLGDVGYLEVEPCPLDRKYLLERLAVDHTEHRAQHLMPADHIPQGTTQRVAVHGTGKPQRDGDVVGGARPVQLSQEPQPTLRERQRHQLGTLPHRECHPARGGPGQRRGQARRCRSEEQRPYRHLHAQHHAHPAGEPHRQQRMSAQGKEVVVDADGVHAEDLGERHAQQLLAYRDRAAATRVARGPCVGGWQSPAVKLPVHRQRQRVEHHHRRGHHIVRQAMRGELPHSGR